MKASIRVARASSTALPVAMYQHKIRHFCPPAPQVSCPVHGRANLRVLGAAQWSTPEDGVDLASVPVCGVHRRVESSNGHRFGDSQIHVGGIQVRVQPDVTASHPAKRVEGGGDAVGEVRPNRAMAIVAGDRLRSRRKLEGEHDLVGHDQTTALRLPICDLDG